MLILIRGGDVYTPEAIGKTDVLIDHDKIIKVGDVDQKALDLLGIEYEVIEAKGCVVTPSFIDPHVHLLGGSGEDGLSKQSPMIFLSEIIPFGTTTVVGVLGVDTTMKTMAGLLARVKGLRDEYLTTRMWSGGYNVPPTSVMRTIREDLLFIDEVVGAGEIAISDKRSLQQSKEKLAEVVLDTHVGGLLSGKAGLSHFHVGEEDSRLAPLRELLNSYHIEPCWLYPTHVTRSEKLFDEALELAMKGSPIDTDTIEGNLIKWVRIYLEKCEDRTRFTISSDAGESSPSNLYKQFKECVVKHGIPLETMLPFCTSNTADILELTVNGRLITGNDGNVLVMTKKDLDVREVISMGKRMVKDGSLVVFEDFLQGSDRNVTLEGKDMTRDKRAKNNAARLKR